MKNRGLLPKEGNVLIRSLIGDVSLEAHPGGHRLENRKPSDLWPEQFIGPRALSPLAGSAGLTPTETAVAANLLWGLSRGARETIVFGDPRLSQGRRAPRI